MQQICATSSPEFTWANYDASVRCTSGVRFLSEDPLGFKAGINFYAYVGNNPVNYNDPSGQIVPQLIGGTVNAVAGIGINLLLGNGFNPASVGVDFLTGAAGVGLISRFNQLSTLTRIGATGATNSGLFAAGTATTNSINTFVDGGEFSFDSVTNGISAGSLLASGFLGIPSSGVRGSIASNAPEGFSTLFERSMVEIGFQTPTDIAVGFFGQGTVAPSIDNFFSGSGSNASGGFVIYPNKINSNMIESVYSK